MTSRFAPSPVKPLLLRITRAGEVAGCGRTKAYEYAANGTWETVETPHGRRVVTESVERWIESLREGQS